MAKSTPVKYTCECGKALRLPPEKIGAGLKCPRCSKPIGKGSAPARSTRADAEESGGKRRAGSSTRRTKRETTRRRPRTDRQRAVKPAETPEPEPEPEDEDDVVEPEAEAPPPMPTPPPIDDDDDDDDDAPEEAPTRRPKTSRSPAIKRGGSGGSGGGGGGAPRRARPVEGASALSKVSSFAVLFGLLVFVGCDLLATYFVMKGPEAPMATTQREAVTLATAIGIFGLVTFLACYVIGQFGRVLLSLTEQVQELKGWLEARGED